MVAELHILFCLGLGGHFGKLVEKVSNKTHASIHPQFRIAFSKPDQHHPILSMYAVKFDIKTWHFKELGNSMVVTFPGLSRSYWTVQT